MTDGSGWRYYAALVASALSVAGWLGALASGGLAVYYAVTSGPVQAYATYALVAVVVGALFAQVEKRLYRPER